MELKSPNKDRGMILERWRKLYPRC